MSEQVYVTKDSGSRVEYESGMRRDVQTGKARYDLIWRPGLKRVAELLARGAEKYGENNWMLANSEDELKRFQASGLRHHMQYLEGERDEDHMAAVVFNLFAAEMVREKLVVDAIFADHYANIVLSETLSVPVEGVSAKRTMLPIRGSLLAVGEKPSGRKPYHDRVKDGNLDMATDSIIADLGE